MFVRNKYFYKSQYRMFFITDGKNTDTKGTIKQKKKGSKGQINKKDNFVNTINCKILT